MEELVSAFNLPHPILLGLILRHRLAPHHLPFFLFSRTLKDPSAAAAAAHHHDPAASSSPLTSEGSSIRTLSSTAETAGGGGFDAGGGTNGTSAGAINLSVDRPQQQQQDSGNRPPLAHDPSKCLHTFRIRKIVVRPPKYKNKSVASITDRDTLSKEY